MTEQAQRTILLASLAALLLGAAASAMGWGPRAAAGVLAGGAWNLASLWCLTRLLAAWVGPTPSKRRVVGWLLVKFPLLYAAITLLFVTRAVPLAAFGAGFSIVLVAAIALLAADARRFMRTARL